ncbi:cation diffusion facilitator family transporter [Amycolatopsis nigrescens]|uniref:cation diffusion facilitator family transporter n=1 Tax=Amycolatopsis nigrescens TaxID=381445 RepID=UPI00037FC84F|nr:cation diffusion facilitator family transporter [Amycolatopsis nigrescens]
MSASEGHGHGHTGRWARLTALVRPHSHDTADRVDAQLKASSAGLRALWISLGVLALTAAGQAVVVTLSGSVALLSDTLHNLADALTAVPVGIAFLIGRRRATRRFTYGFGRAEDLAGVVVVMVIAGSAVAALVESLRRLAEPAEVRQLPAVAVAAIAGFAGNEIAAQVRIRAGRRIGSAALVADGLHARADAITSLAVLLSAGGAALGWRLADPIIGLLIAAAIGVVTYSAAKQVFGRLMDAVDPELIDLAHAELSGLDQVRRVDRVRLRWIGHELHAEVELAVRATLPFVDAHEIAHRAEHRLRHAVPRFSGATVHVHPEDAHARSAPG